MDSITDVVNALVSPANKLIECVARAIGKIYEPLGTKRRAKAEAEKIKLISATVRENADIPIIYNNGDLMIDTTDYE